MRTLSHRKGFKPFGNIIETFFARSSGHSGVHVGVFLDKKLIILLIPSRTASAIKNYMCFASNCGFQIFASASKFEVSRRVTTLFQKLQMPHRMSSFTWKRRLMKNQSEERLRIPSAVERKITAASAYPSTSACCAKYKYRRLAFKRTLKPRIVQPCWNKLPKPWIHRQMHRLNFGESLFL